MKVMVIGSGDAGCKIAQTLISKNIEDAADCDLIIEAMVEDIEIKKQLFKQLNYICKRDTIFVSNTKRNSLLDMKSIS